jgi:hypothetical protein
MERASSKYNKKRLVLSIHSCSMGKRSSGTLNTLYSKIHSLYFVTTVLYCIYAGIRRWRDKIEVWLKFLAFAFLATPITPYPSSFQNNSLPSSWSFFALHLQVQPGHTLQRKNAENLKQIFPEKEYRCLSPNFHIHHVSVRELYISTMELPFLCWWKYVDRSWDYINRSRTHECGNWG